MDDHSIDGDQLAREWRGMVYQARQRVRRLEGAYPPSSRNQHNDRAIAQARSLAAQLIRQARAEGVRVLASRGRSHV